MLDELLKMFSYDFILRALIVGVLVSVSSSLIGTSLVLKRYSMIGDGLSHVAYGALAIGLACNATPMYVAIPVVIAAAFILLRLSSNSKIKGDAAIGLLSSSALAIGMVVLAANNVNIDVDSYMFGSILSLTNDDVILTAICTALVLVLFLVFYHRIFAVTFDESFSKATGIKVGFYNTLIAVLTSVIIVVGMRLMGALLISSLMIFPSLTSMRVFGSYRAVTISSVIISVVCFVAGLVITFCFPLPTGATIVVINLFVFTVFSAIGAIRSGTGKKE